MLEDEFGDLVAKARSGLGLSPDDLSQRAGVDTASISAFEGYRRSPTREQSDSLASVLGLDPPKLWEIAAETWEPAPVIGLIEGRYPIEYVWYEGFRVWTYILGDPDSGACVIVDPGGDAGDTRKAMKGRGWEIVAVLATHTHRDHVGVLRAIVAGSDDPVYVGAEEVSAISAEAGNVRGVSQGDTVKVGPWTVAVKHTPGHSAGSVCYLIGDGIFVGDAMFAGSVGRTNLGVDAYVKHIESVRREVLGLPPATKIFPGHGAQTTVAEELDHNPFF